MFIAMNRFRIALGFEAGFERMWRERESFLGEVPGFQSFALLKGPERDDHRLYASHTIWKSRADFEAWTRSEHFRKAHAQRSAPKAPTSGIPSWSCSKPWSDGPRDYSASARTAGRIRPFPHLPMANAAPLRLH